jgi:hypothetical protein
LGIDVVDGDALVVLVLDPGGNLPGDDAFEKRRGGHGGARLRATGLEKKEIE